MYMVLFLLLTCVLHSLALVNQAIWMHSSDMKASNLIWPYGMSTAQVRGYMQLLCDVSAFVLPFTSTRKKPQTVSGV